MDFTTWLTTWLSRHPLQMPQEPDRARYTADVMTRIRALEPPAASPAPIRLWGAWPRPVVAWASAAAGLLVLIGVLSVVSGRSMRLARHGQQLVLAESSPSEDAWLDETMALFELLDEEITAESAGESIETEEDWLQELQWLDEADLASSS